jgi:hypothetical protein
MTPDEARSTQALLARPIPEVTRNAGHTVRAVMPAGDHWYVAAEDDSRSQWVTWACTAWDDDGQLVFDAGNYFFSADRDRNRQRAMRDLARRAGIKVVYPDPEELTEDQVYVQRLAEMMWKTATSENHAIARYDLPVYANLERALIAAIREVYGLTLLKARRVRDLLSKYGPDDSLTGTTGRGIASYVQFVRENTARDHYYDR